MIKLELLKIADELDAKGFKSSADAVDKLILELDKSTELDKLLDELATKTLPKLEPIPETPNPDIFTDTLNKLIEENNKILSNLQIYQSPPPDEIDWTETDKIAKQHDDEVDKALAEAANQTYVGNLDEPVADGPKPETKSSLFPFLAAAGLLGAGFLFSRSKPQQVAAKTQQALAQAKN